MSRPCHAQSPRCAGRRRTLPAGAGRETANDLHVCEGPQHAVARRRTGSDESGTVEGRVTVRSWGFKSPLAHHEVDRPNRRARRRYGKSDPADARAAARAVQSGEATGTPKAGDDAVAPRARLGVRATRELPADGMSRICSHLRASRGLGGAEWCSSRCVPTTNALESSSWARPRAQPSGGLVAGHGRVPWSGPAMTSVRSQAPRAVRISIRAGSPRGSAPRSPAVPSTSAPRRGPRVGGSPR
jgi:hypothetical protein